MILVRAMEAADLDWAIALCARLEGAPEWSRAVWERVLETDPRRVAVVADDEWQAGFAVATVVGPEAELELIAVAPERQRRGVARALMAELAGRVREAGAEEMVLEVRASNRAALGLYEQAGFVVTGGRARYYRDPVEDAVLMWMRLV